VKAFESYHPTYLHTHIQRDRHTDRQALEIIHPAALQVVNNNHI